MCGCLSGIASWKTAAQRQDPLSTNSRKPGRSSSEKSSVVKNQSDFATARSHFGQATGATASPSSSRRREFTRVSPDLCAEELDLVTSKKIIFDSPRRRGERGDLCVLRASAV